MKRFFKYWTSYFSYQWHHLVAGQKWHTNPQQLTLLTTSVKNKKLAKDMEDACKKNGFLTYKEFLDISQFGSHGYYANNKYHGMTDSFVRWGEPIIKLCKENNIHQVIEFGCGDGKLGVTTIRAAKKADYEIFWTGIDIGQKEREKVKEYFTKEQVLERGYELASSIEEINVTKPCLAVFSYSLDSVSPDLFINTSNTKTYPDTMIGITVKNGVLQEILLTKDQLRKKGISITKGHFINQVIFDLSSWQLFPNQRAFIPIEAFSVLLEFSKKLPKGSLLLILDEMQPKALPWDKSTLCSPKDLDRYDPYRIIDTKKLTHTAGENLLYYPAFSSSYVSLLKSIGCTDIHYNSEHLVASKNLEQLDTLPNERYLCYMILGKLTKKINSQLVIHFPY